MKRFFSAFLTISMIALSVVPAYAADSVRYVPQIPDFATVAAGGVNISVPIDKTSPDVQLFFSDFYSQPYLILLDQWTSTEYYPEFPTSGTKPQFVGEDRKWNISFVKPDNLAHFRGYDFTYYDSLTYNYNRPRPMRVSRGGTDTQGTFSVLTYQYNFATKKFDKGTVYTSQTDSYFSYVIGSASISGSSLTYPNFTHVLGKPITVSSYIFGGSAAHYPWWIGRKNISTDTSKPPVPPVDPPPIDPDPPIDPEPPWTPDPPSPPGWDDIKPDKPLKPFDPDTDTGGFVPPPDDGGYDPLPPGYVPPSMPDWPLVPTIPPSTGDNPFLPPTIPPSTGDNPFLPPTVPPSTGDNPFLPPTVPPSTGDNPFLPPTVPPSTGDNPFLPPTVPPSTGDNPFLPPTIPPSTGDNPFLPPTIPPSTGDNPFLPPTIPPSTGDNPFLPPSPLWSGKGKLPATRFPSFSNDLFYRAFYGLLF